MNLRIIWTEHALVRTEEIADFIAAERPQAARALLQRILESVERLSEFPYLGRPYAESDDASLREAIIDSYRIIYRVAEAENAVYVLTVRHGRRAPLAPDEF